MATAGTVTCYFSEPQKWAWCRVRLCSQASMGVISRKWKKAALPNLRSCHLPVSELSPGVQPRSTIQGGPCSRSPPRNRPAPSRRSPSAWPSPADTPEH